MREWVTARKGKVDVTVTPSEPVSLTSDEARELAAALTAAADNAEHQPDNRSGVFYTDQFGTLYVTDAITLGQSIALWQLPSEHTTHSWPLWASYEHWVNQGAELTPLPSVLGGHFELKLKDIKGH